MLRALWSGASGMKAQSRNIDVIANNLANVNTSGFKKSKALFSDLQYQQIRAPGVNVSADSIDPTGIEVGHGVRNSSVIKIFTQGELDITDRGLDLTIEGKGFFKVLNSAGEEFYTRNGSFTVNNEGTVVTNDGYVLDGNYQVDDSIVNISVGKDGTITTIDGEQTATPLGRIEVFNFNNEGGLSSKNGSTLFQQTAASGDAVGSPAGEAGVSLISSGMLELSNVTAVDEMVGMIKAQRAYELNSRSITTADQMLQEVNNLKR